MSPNRPKKVSNAELKKFLETKKRDTRLIGHIERHILLRPVEERRRSILHPSDIVKAEWCALHAYHDLKGNYVATQEKPGLRLQSIFDEGHNIHSKWQGYIREMGNLYGVWELGETRTWTTSDSITDAHNYREVPLHSDKHRIAGHADGWVKGLGDDFLIEIKSMGAGTFRFEAPGLLAGANGDVEAAWRAVRQPFRSHLLQGQVYLHLCHLMVGEGKFESAPDEIVFVYELKANQDYKEFSVKYDPEYVTEIFDNALDVVWAVDNDKPPACNIDPVNGCPRCQSFR